MSVRQIYNYYKQHDYKSDVMDASFRNTGEIEAPAGCARLTTSPALVKALREGTVALERRLSPENTGEKIEKVIDTESTFRFALNDDAMATEKLAEGIRNFAADQIKLENLLKERA